MKYTHTHVQLNEQLGTYKGKAGCPPSLQQGPSSVVTPEHLAAGLRACQAPITISSREVGHAQEATAGAKEDVEKLGLKNPLSLVYGFCRRGKL